MNQKWTLTAGVFKPEQIVICNRLNLFFAQEPVNRQIYVFKDFDSEADLNAYVRRMIDNAGENQDRSKQLFD